MEPLQHQKPKHDQRRVDAVVSPDTSLALESFQKIEGEEGLKQRSDAADQGFINNRRERECSSCLKLGYPLLPKKQSNFE
jgi:hypothetical protein